MSNTTAPWYALPHGRLSHDSDVLIVGAGLAGCWAARLLAEADVNVTVCEASDTVASGASGNPVGLVKPHLAKTPNEIEHFLCDCFDFLIEQLIARQWQDEVELNLDGVFQLVDGPWPERQGDAGESAGKKVRFANRAYKNQNGEVSGHSLQFDTAGYLSPKKLCLKLLDHHNINVKLGSSFKLSDSTANENNFDAILLCTGAAGIGNLDTEALPLVPARGQISEFAYAEGSSHPPAHVNGKRYLIKNSNNSIWAGASFQRNQTDCETRADDELENKHGAEALVDGLKLSPKALNNRVAIRATTPDRLPLLGPLPNIALCREVYADLKHGRPASLYPDLPCENNIWLHTGLGSRGIVTSAYSSFALVNHLLGQDSKLQNLQPLLCPARFLIRQLKRS